MPNEASRVAGALTGDGAGHLLLPSPVRKARLPKSKQQLAEEAARVLHQVDKVDCVANDHGVHPDKFYTLPARRKHKINADSPQSSLDRKTRRRRSEELGVTVESPPKKPPRTFAHYPKAEKPPRTSIFNIFKKSEKEPPPESAPKKSNLRRSVSDATNLKSKAFVPDDDKPFRKRSGSESEENAANVKGSKKQLSPIIEVQQREDYFSAVRLGKENVDSAKRKKEKKGPIKPESVTEKLKEYIDEVDTALFNETGVKVQHPENEKKVPEIVIIDVDKAEKISRKKDKSGSIGRKFKFLGNRKDKPAKDKEKPAKDKEKPAKPTKDKAKKKKSPANAKKKVKPEDNSDNSEREQVRVEVIKIPDAHSPSPKIKEVIDSLQHSGIRSSPKMIHSSQKPAEKLPLTRGLTVDTMVRRLNNDKSSPSPPKTTVMVTPHVTVQHNNNQPFSYIRGHSPERNYRSPEGSRSPVNPGSPIIYAHVVCDKGNSGPTKQTVHAAYTNGKKHLPHSDSDEGLGTEENSGFGRAKYEAEKTVTHFGDERCNGFSNRNFYKDPEHFEEEYPITPKFKNVGHNGFGNFNGYTKTEHSIFIDSSSRGRGDGMDSKRRESLTEPHENGFVSPKYNINSSRTDLSARRDLLESRINRRLGDKGYRQTSPPAAVPYNANSKYVSETTAKYYRHGSASPVGFAETYVAETKTDRNGERHTTEARTHKNYGHSNRYRYDNEPKSFDSQVSDYRSSPEHAARRIDASHDYRYSHSNKYDKQKLIKDREHYKSNPEILHRSYDDEDRYQETYHDSLRRERHETHTSKYHQERYLDHSDERKDKLGDSGIENDFKRGGSGDNFRTPRSSTQRREYCNDSEDEGFASSLLIASERQHTEDNFSRKRREYDSDRGYRDDPYRNTENMEYKVGREYKSRHEYAPRERSIDDGSHYDPRIDKDFDAERSTLKKKVDKKPPKPEKKSGLEKVKQLFSRDSKKKKDKEKVMVPEDNLRARYTEYKGSHENLEPRAVRKTVSEVKSSYDYSNRRRLSTPSPSPTREVQRNGKETTHGSWFKSLDRLSRKKKKDEKDATSEEEIPAKPTPAKNLRFFGDTDIESNDSLRQKPSIKTRPPLTNSNHHERTRSQSTRDLHNISEERQSPEFITPIKSSHKSLLNVSESERETKGSRLSLKPPISPNHRATREVQRPRDERGRRRKNEVSSVESSTEGDSSQQSQRSVVYLHAATVGDIPGPGYLRNGRRAASREELTSNGSSQIRPQQKTLSRSFSVLAPWKPRHIKEGYDIDYTQYPKQQTKSGKYEQKVTKNGNSRKDNSSTLKKKANETRRSNQNMSTLSRRSRSKENLSSQTLKKSKEDLTKGSSSTLYKKKERQPKENMRYNRDREERRISSKSMSVESLGNGRADRRSRDEGRDVSRSISMPRDPEKSAGWFKMNKKSKKSLSTQRL